MNGAPVDVALAAAVVDALVDVARVELAPVAVEEEPATLGRYLMPVAGQESEPTGAAGSKVPD